MAEKAGDQDTLALAAHVDGKLSGFAVASIQENGPLLAPARFSYVGLIVVARDARRARIREALWRRMREWFLSTGLDEVQLYTEVGNELSNGFWDRREFRSFLTRRRRRIA
jgi:ribosomal protein S18 acetylase RimI-like enzyme